MAYIKQGNNAIFWGRATKDAQIRQTTGGKTYATVSLQYGKHYDADGNTVRDYIDCSFWGDYSNDVGDPNIGITHGDIVMMAGMLYKDDYKSEKEGRDIYSLNADIIINSSASFMMAKMLVDPGAEEPIQNPAPQKKSTFVSSRERTPFEDMMDDEDGELPY